MQLSGTGRRVRIYVGEQDKRAGGHRPVWEDVLALLRDEGAAGATVFRGLAGFGAHSRVHMARLADLAPDLPLVVEWIDAPDRVERLPAAGVCDGRNRHGDRRRPGNRALHPPRSAPAAA